MDPNEPAEEEDGGRVAGAPLWFASMCGRYDIAELLIARGADVNAVLNGNADALYCAERTGDEQMQALLLKHGARTTVERVAGRKDRETARAILEGRVPGTSLNVEEPTLTELAEQMLWAAGSCDAEIVRMCLPYVTRQPEDPWWNYVLMHATLPESFQLVLDHGVDPDVTGVGGHTTLQHLATATVGDEHRITRATLLLDAGASLGKRDRLLKSTPLGLHRARQTVPEARRGRRGSRWRALGYATGMGHEGRASRDCRAAPLAGRQVTFCLTDAEDAPASQWSDALRELVSRSEVKSVQRKVRPRYPK